MDKQNQATAKILLADGNTYMRQSIHHALAYEGYRDVRSLSRLALLRDVLGASIPDLLILDIDMADGDAIALVRDVRNGNVGRNPFLPIIFTSWDSDRPLVRRVVDSGADMLLVKPLAPAQLLNRIDSIIKDRNPFVVTADYIGPDRRQDSEPGDIERFTVPNTLKDKVEGTVIDYAVLQDQIDMVSARINESRLIEDASKITSLVAIITNSYTQNKVGKAAKSQMDQIIRCTEDFVTRIAGTEFERLAGVCGALLKASRHIHRRPKKADRQQVDLLKPLADTIFVGVNPDLDCETGIQEVKDIVDRCGAPRGGQPVPQV